MALSKLLIIAGATASGKTELGIKLAKKFNGEIVSADSRHVYKGMDIGTGKDIPKNSKLITSETHSKLKNKNSNLAVGYRFNEEIPVWLVDVVNPDYQFNLSDYVRLAQIAIENIWSRKKLALVVGGTGLYIKALITPLQNINIRPDIKLRKKLGALDLIGLQNKLSVINPEKFGLMNNSDRQNPRRLIRAIEIAENKIKNKTAHLLSDWLMVYLKSDLKLLYEKIDRRVEERIKEGIVDEIKILLKKGYSFDLPSFSACGYRLFKTYFQGIKSAPELAKIISIWKFEEHALARRQITWFKKMQQDQLYSNKIIAEDLNNLKRNILVSQIEQWYTSFQG